jgi:ketosteroid isomerase-like protein
MRRILLAGAVLASLGGRPTTAIEPGNRQVDTAQLTGFACEAGQAYARRDLEALERLTAEDYSQTDVRGSVLDRSAWFDFVKSRKSELKIECDDIRVRFYGDAAVVTGRWRYTMTRDGEKLPTATRWTSVWTRYPEGWKRHAFQNTYINLDADRCALAAPH